MVLEVAARTDKSKDLHHMHYTAHDITIYVNTTYFRIKLQGLKCIADMIFVSMFKEATDRRGSLLYLTKQFILAEYTTIVISHCIYYILFIYSAPFFTINEEKRMSISAINPSTEL